MSPQTCTAADLLAADSIITDCNGAIYDALVRMAQPFSLRHPLIDFHGNYGSPDFGPAASRYTECRLHPLAMQLLSDIDENTVAGLYSSMKAQGP